jgi:hypothetical protein
MPGAYNTITPFAYRGDIVLAAQCRGRHWLATRWIDFPVVVIRAPRELAIGNVGRPVERLGPLALPVDIGCLARRTGRGYDE